MATAAELAAARYQQVTATERSLVATIQQIWRDLSAPTIAEDLQGEAGAAILAAVVEGQLTVAEGAQAFVAACMAAQGAAGAAEAAVVASAFAGIAPDGGPLETLLFLPAVGVQRRLAGGMTAQEAMLGGLADMAMYAATAVADTARSAAQVAMAADRRVVAYTRVVRLPACSRCIVLSGQQYRYSEGFLRHPNCDCQTVPLHDVEWREVPTPQELYESMSEAERRRTFTAAGAEAIERGADVAQVVNARRGMSRPGGRTTTEGITRRGLYGRRVRRVGGEFTRVPGQRYSQAVTPRLTPDELFRTTDDRGEQIRLLRRYGYMG